MATGASVSAITSDPVSYRGARFATPANSAKFDVECGLDDAGILTGLDLLFQILTLGTAGDVDQWGPTSTANS
jgi:hypothetical protein